MALDAPLHWKAGDHIRALIFDCDGTLADTMPTHYRAWVAMLADHGIDFPETQFYGLAGVPSVAIIERLAADQGVPMTRDLAVAMTAEKEQRYLAVIDEVTPIGEVVAVAAHHRGTHRLGVGSGGERWIVDHTLQAIGVHEWIEAIVGADDTERHKPEPDVFLEVARRLGVAPAACAVFEDSDLGLEAARRAGMDAVDIRPWRTR